VQQLWHWERDRQRAAWLLVSACHDLSFTLRSPTASLEDGMGTADGAEGGLLRDGLSSAVLSSIGHRTRPYLAVGRVASHLMARLGKILVHVHVDLARTCHSWMSRMSGLVFLVIGVGPV
jgi:hypothetical protein